MSDKRRFSAKSMFSELKSSKEFFLTGMVKDDPNDPSVVLMATDNDCDDWIAISEALIEGYERHGSATCRDHSHPVVTLKLRQPHTAEAGIFARALPRLLTPERVSASMVAAGSPTDCFWDTLQQRWVDRLGRPCTPR